jgi:hypothetical protein
MDWEIDAVHVDPEAIFVECHVVVGFQGERYHVPGIRIRKVSRLRS